MKGNWMWENLDEEERARRLKEAEADEPYLRMSYFKAVENRDLDLALKIMNAHVRKATRDGYEATLAHCIETYPEVVRTWGLNDVQAAALIDVDHATWNRIKAADREVGLGQEQLSRMSAVIIISRRLRELFVNDLSDRWPTLPNKGELSGGRTPVEAMIREGFAKMREVEAHIESLQGL